MYGLNINRKHMIRTLVLTGLAAISLTACSQAPVQTTPTPKAPLETPGVQPTPSPTALAAPFTFPLTGMPSQQQVKTRPFLVMVENAPQARPQSGLDQADIVYEILAEGEVTRFVSVFQSHDAKVIGPVRSIRPYFVEIGAALDAVIVHAGWSQEAMNILSGRNLSHLDQVYGDHKYYWRSSDRKAPHNLYTSVEKMTQGEDERKFRKEWKSPVLSFAGPGQSLLQGTAANRIEIPYIMGYAVSYDYDAAAGVFKRSMDGKPHRDKESGAQLSAKNVLVLESRHQIVDKVGRREVDIFGPGKGMLFQEGKSGSVTWEQKNGIIRTYQNGREIPLLPGATWVQIVPEGTAVKTD